jgi:hypothetical protein
MESKEYFHFEIGSSLDDSVYEVICTRKWIGQQKSYDRYEFGLYDKSDNKSCVNIHIYYSKDTGLPTLAEVSHLKYKQECSIQKTLQKGIGTRNMFLTALTFCSKITPGIQSFQFKDFSEKECENGANIHLGYYSLVMNGKTWYEKNFGAHLKFPLFQNMFIQEKQKLFQKDCIGVDLSDILESNQVHTLLKQQLIKIYSESQHYSDFFKKIHEKYGMLMMCEIMQPWIRDFMRKLDFEKYFYMDWEITVETVLQKQAILDKYKMISKHLNQRGYGYKKKETRRNKRRQFH